MIIELVKIWGAYPVYKASYNGVSVYGKDFMHAITNMLNVISNLN